MTKQAFVTRDEDRIIFDKKITRRKFLKGSAAAAAVTGATLAVSGARGTVMKALAAADGNQPNVPEEQVYAGVCPVNCGANSCQMHVHVRNGKIVKTSVWPFPEPDSDYTRICQRGLSHVQMVYGPERLKYPMRRVGKRGSGEWEQISWEEAIDYISSKWKGYKKDFGDSSVAYFQGTGNGTQIGSYYQRLFNLIGSTNVVWSFDRGYIDTATPILGFNFCIFGNESTDLVNAKNILIWGHNPTEAAGVKFIFLQNAIEKGANVTVIDPNYIGVASKAHKFIPIRPATDAALAMAMTNIIVQEGLDDKAYIASATVGPFLVKESDGKFLRLSDMRDLAEGEQDAIVVRSADGQMGLPAEIPEPVIHGTFMVNGIKVTTAYDLLLERIAEWTPEKASELCDIPVETIKELTHTYVDGPSTLYLGYGQDHWGNGHTFYKAVFALAMVAGQMGKPGTGFSGVDSIPIPPGSGNPAIFMPEGAVPGPAIYSAKLPDVLNEGKYGETSLNIKSLFIYANNPIRTQAGRKTWIETFDKLDLIVVADRAMTETAKYADVLLPVPHFFETETFGNIGTPYICLSEKAVMPAFECKDDFEIASLLGKAMGFEDKFTMTNEEYHAALLDNDTAKQLGLSWETLKQQKRFRTLPSPVIHAANGVHWTATGRGEFYLENFAPNTNYGQEIDKKREALPYWEPPLEGWHENPLFKKYPLILMTERDKFKAHTQFNRCQWFQEIAPEPTVRMNPKDAKERGIKHGDTIKLFNDRGYVVLKVEISSGNRPGVLITDHGWESDQYIDGSYADLTTIKTSNSIINNAYFDCLVEAQKV
jgi:molybdopterin-containing oxidoreductase family molybdopterin binding subunit